MEQTNTAAEPSIIGIDVSKDRLDVAVHASGEVFVTSRDAATNHSPRNLIVDRT